MAPAWEVPWLMNLNETYISESASIIKPLWRGISTSLGLTIASVHAAVPFAGWSEIVTSTGLSFETLPVSNMVPDVVVYPISPPYLIV